jgi:hypothetical protein
LRQLDLVSGDLNALGRIYRGEKGVEWSKEEDELLSKNPELIKKWKGVNAAELRKKYLQYKSK